MTTFTQEDIRLSKLYSVSPLSVRHIEDVYDTIKRFIGANLSDVNGCFSQTRHFFDYNKPPLMKYHDIPQGLKNALRSIITRFDAKTEELECDAIWSWANKADSKHNFFIWFIKGKRQPKDYLFDGSIAFHMVGKYEDNTTIRHKDSTFECDVVEYKE